MIQLVPYEEKYFKALTEYPLSEAQLKFTGHPLELLERAATNSTYNPIIILEDQQVVGFFVLDSGEDRFYYTENLNTILLRGYSVHANCQGRGIAKESMRLLPLFVQANFPQVKEVVLGVNEANKIAQTVYLKANFIDEGKRHIGRSGMQIAMSKAL